MMETRTLADLLHKFLHDPGIAINRKQMTACACKYVVKSLGYDTRDQVPIYKVRAGAKSLDLYLKELTITRKLSSNSARNYRSFYSRFVQWAQENQFIPKLLTRELLPDWDAITFPLRDVSSGRRGWRGALRRLGHWATGFNLKPSQLAPDRLLEYMSYLRSDSGIGAWRQIYHRAEKEWNLHQIDGKVPQIKWPALPTNSRSSYTLRLHDWPSTMQTDYEKYRSWCLVDFSIDRKPEYRQRPVSADQNLSNMERILGFAHRIQGRKKEDFSMNSFFDQELILAYFSWMVQNRLNGKMTVTLERIAAQLLGMARGYFQKSDAEEWLLRLKHEVSGAEVRNKKLLILSMEELQQIADGIHDLRLEELKHARVAKRQPSLVRQARLVLRELAFRLLMQRPLRQKNLRQIQLDKNLIRNGDGTYALSFSGPEMKNNQPLEFPFPNNLMGLLEVYLQKHRPVLCNGHENPYLFPNPSGGHISAHTVQNFIKTHSQRVLGKHLFPHLFRDSVAFWILKQNPGDLLLVSKLLGHADIKTTIKIYSNIGPEDAAESLDKMFSERGLGKL